MQEKHKSIVQWIGKHYPSQLENNSKLIYIAISEQKLYLLDSQKIINTYVVSTSRHGIGNKENSYKTPTGLHKIAEKIGADCKQGEIFKARVSTGEVAVINSKLAKEQDQITSRILWLEGLEQGINKGPGVDSYQRYIYIHGTSDETSIGQATSIGCIRMTNVDVISLFNEATEGMTVILKA